MSAPTNPRRAMMSELDRTSCILNDLHDSEINFHLSCFFDGGFTVKIGDEMNGFAFSGTASRVEDAVEWLRIRAMEHYPDSLFAKTYREVTPMTTSTKRPDGELKETLCDLFAEATHVYVGKGERDPIYMDHLSAEKIAIIRSALTNESPAPQPPVEGLREALREAIDVFEGMNDDEINEELLPRLKAALASPSLTAGLDSGLRRAWLDRLNAIAPAVENLASHQEQCDFDGVMVKVSRQALDEVLNAVNDLAVSFVTAPATLIKQSGQKNISS